MGMRKYSAVLVWAATARVVLAGALLVLHLPATRLQGSPPLGRTIGARDLLCNTAAVPRGNDRVVPLVAAPPDWYTAAMTRQVIKAARMPVAALSRSQKRAKIHWKTPRRARVLETR